MATDKIAPKTTRASNKTPAANKGSGRTASSKALPPPPEKKTFKLTPQQVQVIIDLALNGYTIKATRQYIHDEYGISITDQAVLYHRRQARERMAATIDEEIAAARANCPELATLSGRLVGLRELIEREIKRKKSSTKALIEAYAAADTAIYHAEVLRLRYRESLAKFPDRTDNEAEKLLQEIERRSHSMRNITDSAEAVARLAGNDFRPDGEATAEEPALEVEGVVEGDIEAGLADLDESALIGG